MSDILLTPNPKDERTIRGATPSLRRPPMRSRSFAYLLACQLVLAGAFGCAGVKQGGLNVGGWIEHAGSQIGEHSGFVMAALTRPPAPTLRIKRSFGH